MATTTPSTKFSETKFPQPVPLADPLYTWRKDVVTKKESMPLFASHPQTLYEDGKSLSKHLPTV